MKNGFTLIELLAVIVILAIIALIATPIVLGIINDSKQSSNKVSATYIIDAVEQSYSMAYALKMGAVPTLKDVRDHFNMENAKWVEEDDKQFVKSTDGNVTCEVKVVEQEFYVDCSEFAVRTMTMAISEEPVAPANP